MIALAVDLDNSSSSLRHAWSSEEVAALAAGLAAAQDALEAARGYRHGEAINELAARVDEARAALDAADRDWPTAAFRVGQVVRIGSELLRVARVGGTTIDVRRGVDGTAPAAHPAGSEIASRSTTIEIVLDPTPVPVVVPFPGSISRVRLVASEDGDAEISISRRDAAGGSAVPITGGSPPALSSSSSYDDRELAGWSTALGEGDVILAALGAGTLERVTLVLSVDL
jgi:hypothetical protein